MLVALSGGADSLALAAAVAFEAPRADLRAGAVVVDHGLQEDSAGVAGRAAGQARALGLEPVIVARVEVDGGPASRTGGVEAAARSARYRALVDAARETEAVAILLGHTLDDQAETVLLGLARGSGPTSLAGMPAAVSDRGARFVRPLLGIRRATTRAFCADSRLEPWNDPHNEDAAYTRVRVRRSVLPVLERELGPGVAEALTRTAEVLAEDAAALDDMVREVAEDVCEHVEAGVAVSVAALEANPPALRNRLIRFVAQSEFGVSLSRTQTLAVARLVTEWRGQGPLDLPGFTATRREGRIVLTAAGEPGNREPAHDPLSARDELS